MKYMFLISLLAGQALYSMGSNRVKVFEVEYFDSEEGITPLMTAANEGNLDECKKLVTNGESVDAVDGFHRRALLWAVGGGNLEVCQFFVDEGAIHDKKLRRKLLLLAARSGYGMLCRYWNIDAGLSYEEILSSLDSAAERGYADVCIFLLEQLLRFTHNDRCYMQILGSITTIIDKIKTASLKKDPGSEKKIVFELDGEEHIKFRKSSADERTEVLRLLEEEVSFFNSLNVDFLDRHRLQTLFHHDQSIMLRRKEDLDRASQDRLVERKKRLVAARNRWEPLADPKNSALFELMMKKDYSLKDIAKLIDEGADVNARNQSGQTPLFLASLHNRSDICNYLVARGAQVRLRTNTGFSVLHNAVEHRNLELCRLFIDHRALLDVQTTSGLTPMHIACRLGIEEIVKCLIGAGADINLVACNGITPLLSACVSASPYSNTLNSEIITCLILAGANVNVAVSVSADNCLQDWTQLMFCAAAQNLDGENLCKLLLDRGADPKAKSHHGGETALMHALHSFETPSVDCSPESALALVQLLVNRGSDVLAKNKNGKTPVKLVEEFVNLAKRDPRFVNSVKKDHLEKFKNLVIGFLKEKMEEATCQVCMDAAADTATCDKHKACQTCANKWLQQKKGCPWCRQ